MNQLYDLIRLYAGTTIRLEHFTELRHRNICKAIQKRSNQEYLFYVLNKLGLYALKEIKFCSCLNVMYCGGNCRQIVLYMEIIIPNSAKKFFN